KTINGNALKDMENDTYKKGFLIEMEDIRNVDSKLINGKADIEKWANFESKCLLHGQYMFKIIEIGDSTVGKTAIKVRFTDNYFKKDLKTTPVSITQQYNEIGPRGCLHTPINFF
ncbi:unnamed protein product, partial [marine sediment metagenome]